jgi:uncharacterized coiled-coil DUF342 family protein
MTTTFLEYSKEIAPLIRQAEYQKDLMKDFKETDEKALELAELIKEAQEALKEYLSSQEEFKALQESLKAIESDIKEAIKAAAKGTDFKPAMLKKFFVARNKEEGVVKVVEAGVTFKELDDMLPVL